MNLLPKLMARMYISCGRKAKLIALIIPCSSLGESPRGGININARCYAYDGDNSKLAQKVSAGLTADDNPGNWGYTLWK